MLKRILILLLISTYTTSCSELLDLLESHKENDKFCSEPMRISEDREPYPEVNSTLPQKNLELKTYSSCSEIEDEMTQRFQAFADDYRQIDLYWQRNRPQCSETSIMDGTTPKANIQDGGVTNRQEQNVDESDIIKTSNHQIYVSKPDFIEVLSRDTLDIQYTLDISDLRDAKLFYSNSVLVSFGRDSKVYNKYKLKFFRAFENSKPELISEFYLNGTIIGARLSNSFLTFITSENLVSNWYNYDEDKFLYQLKQTLSGRDCTQIYKSVIDDMDSQMTTIHQYNLNPFNILHEQKSIMGQFSEIYMSKNNLYLNKPYLNWMYWDVGIWNSPKELFITKWNLRQGFAQAESVGNIRGQTIGQWAYSEVDNALAVATTNSLDVQGSSNQLHILRTLDGTDQLKTVATTEKFGITESIRSVRYLDQKAYVVTFRQTDPLFIIDLENPLGPTILSELKAPGFSRYLHPTSNGQLIGFGYSFDEGGGRNRDNGLQLSLFDINDPLDPLVIEQINMGGPSGFSEVLYNHQAFYYDDIEQHVGFPITEYRNYTYNGGAPASSFSGARFFKQTAIGFEPIAEVSHKKWIAQSCKQNGNSYWPGYYGGSMDIQRIFNLDNRTIAISRNGLTVHDLNNKGQTTREVLFHHSKRDCPKPTYSF